MLTINRNSSVFNTFTHLLKYFINKMSHSMLLNVSRIFFVLILILFASGTIIAQKEQSVYRRLQLNENAIKEISFDYALTKGDTVLTNKYETLIFEYSPDSISSVKKLVLNYVNGKIDGDFYLESTRFKTKDDFPSYKDFRVLRSIEGRAIYSSGNFKQGLQQGVWNQYEVDINDRNQDTISSVSIRFDSRGRWHGLIKYSERKFIFTGEFKDNYPNGVWEGQIDGTKFEYTFQDGVLKAIQIGKKKIDLMSESVTEFKEYPIDEVIVPYLSKNKLGNVKEDSISKLIAHHLFQIVTHFTPDNELISHNDKTEAFLKPIIRLPLFPFSSEDKSNLDEVLRINRKLAPRLDTLLIQPDLVLSCHDNNDIAESMAAFKLVQSRLQVLSPYLQVANSEMGKHLNWNSILKELIHKLNLIHQKNFECLNEKQVYNMSQINYDESKSSFENLFTQVSYLDSIFTTYSKQINTQLETVRLGEELDEIQQRFTRTSLEIDSLSEQTHIPNAEYKTIYLNGFRNFHDLLIRRFRESIQENDPEKSSLLLNEIIKLKSLLEQTDVWVSTHQVIRDKYRYLYLDPNTFEERVEFLYEQIYKTYERKLMPFVMNQLSFNFNNIEEFTKAYENIGILQKRILTVLDENPRQLNRKMKSRDSVEKAMEKLQLILN